jgi:ABC-type Fe3+-siderophore transport system permease subunit
MTGVAMAALYSAISTFLMYVLDENQLESLQRWNAGDISSTVPWMNVMILAIWIIVLFGLTMINNRELDVINLGYDTAVGLGLNVKKTFFINSIFAVGMASVSVAFGGNFFFLGLIGPHIARKLVGTKTKYLIPLAGVVSATIIIVANVMVENVPIFMNIPTGIFVSIISVPYFIYLLIKAR